VIYRCGHTEAYAAWRMVSIGSEGQIRVIVFVGKR
jgi:hypothetical protein